VKRSARAVITAVAIATVTAGGATLTLDGHGNTASAAETVTQAVGLARSALPESARDVQGKAGGELLSVDLRGDGSALVMLYDYASGLTHQVTVDSGKVRSDESAPQTRPPASGDETAAAFGIALRAPHPLPFTATFAQQQGVPLVSADQVEVDAEPWTPSADDAASACASDRCMQLRLATAAGEYLDTSDFVVDLSTRHVLHVKSAL